MEIRRLDPKIYAGKCFTARYQTNGYYEITAAESGFRIAYTPFEAPAAFGAFEQERLLGFAEGSIESWNNRFRISNLCIFDEAARGRALGFEQTAAEWYAYQL